MSSRRQPTNTHGRREQVNGWLVGTCKSLDTKLFSHVRFIFQYGIDRSIALAILAKESDRSPGLKAHPALPGAERMPQGGAGKARRIRRQ